MYTYPVPGSVLNADATAVQVAVFLKSPTLLARRFSEILSAQNFIANAILADRYSVQGGAVAYHPDEAIRVADAPETVNPGAEYPLVGLSPDQLRIVAAMKKGFATEVTDEMVGRSQMAPVERAIALLANTIVDEFDAMTLALVQSAITASVTGTAWTSATAVIADVAKAKAAISKQQKGYKAGVIVLTEDQYAAVTPLLLDVLPREGGNPVASGTFPSLLGLNWLTSENLPSGWVPTVLDPANLGGIGHESIPSVEYAMTSGGSNVEVARYREQNDSTRIQIRKADVPVVRNPGAGVEITGTGL